MAFLFEKQEVNGIVLIKPDCYDDFRGEFLEFYKKSEFCQNGINEDFVQDNFSYSKKNVFRGMHFQKSPHSQAKLVTCIQGEIIDFAIDLRKNSTTFKKTFKTNLSKKNHHFLYIPKGFAHGFLALKNSIVLYKTTKEYSPNSECGINWEDKELSLNLDIDFIPIVSKKDNNLPFLKDIKF